MLATSLVLCAAVLHATWNTLVKFSSDRLLVVACMDVVGVLCTEFFVAKDGRVMINETAPRPHNSGHYTIDAWQRSVLYADIRRQRGNQYLEHVREGQPPVLHFEYEMLADARTFPKPVNYALVRIVPPAGVKIDAESRPYVIIDPRAGHGPGIGGFKDDSQVGVALRAGHPVYFVIFFPKPEPKQTLLDVCEAEREFVRRVRRLHPKSSKPAIVTLPKSATCPAKIRASASSSATVGTS